MKERKNGSTAPCDKAWLSVYLYYAEPWEVFLLKGIQPFVRSILEEKLAKQFFFVRYWEQGPHIRLRMKGEAANLQEEIKPRLESYFNQYFREKPSQRKEPEQPVQIAEEHRWFPNHTIRFVPYEPEIKRYGGPAGILMAEEQFEASSRAVLSIMAESCEWDYERALGAAIQLHLGFVSALGMKLTESIRFFSNIFSTWFFSSYREKDNFPAEEIKKRRDVTLKAFKEILDKQKTILIPFHHTLWNALTKSVSFEEPWLNRWLTDMVGIRKRLKNKNIPQQRQQLWPILGSLVHMTNNRLGILNRDEAFLGFLIKECLEAVRHLKMKKNDADCSDY